MEVRKVRGGPDNAGPCRTYPGSVLGLFLPKEQQKATKGL